MKNVGWIKIYLHLNMVVKTDEADQLPQRSNQLCISSPSRSMDNFLCCILEIQCKRHGAQVEEAYPGLFWIPKKSEPNVKSPGPTAYQRSYFPHVLALGNIPLAHGGFH